MIDGTNRRTWIGQEQKTVVAYFGDDGFGARGAL